MLARALPAVLLLARCPASKVEATDTGESVAPDSDTGDPADADGDGFTGADDCDDTDAAVNPAASEACNEQDDDCDGDVDEGLGTTWYEDADGDGWGDTTSVTACAAPAGFAASDGDCDDADAAVHPGAEEPCSSVVDQNCDGAVGSEDGDGDGVAACDDCDDADPSAAPGLPEICGDGIDNDCSGSGAGCPLSGEYEASSADFYLTGTDLSDLLGCAVVLGDFDGDGTGDLVGGAFRYRVGGHSSAGVAAVWYGPLTASGTMRETGASMLTGSDSLSYVGSALARADHDGDGVDDLVVGAPGVGDGGAVYIVPGGSRHAVEALDAIADVATITAEAEDDYLGGAVAGGGDLDGDGMDEIALGAYLHDTPPIYLVGAAYLLYGDPAPRSGSTDAGSAGASFVGAASSDVVGGAVALVRDMDGDGLDELLIGASGVGKAYLFLGSATRRSGTAYADTADFTYAGGAARDNAGQRVYTLADVTGDGYGDAGVYGNGYDDGATSNVGALWVFGGGASLSASAVATLYGAVEDDAFGDEAGSPGDVDADGTDDVLVGAQGPSTVGSDYDLDESPGAARLWYGPVVGTLAPSSADVTFLGPADTEAQLGSGVSESGGDVTGDGLPDIVIGAHGDGVDADGDSTYAGAIYVWTGTGD